MYFTLIFHLEIVHSTLFQLNVMLLGYGILMNSFLVATQSYNTGSHEEYVIMGNDVLVKCTIPSFLADFLTITGWIDSEGHEFLADSNYGKFNKYVHDLNCI